MYDGYYAVYLIAPHLEAQKPFFLEQTFVGFLVQSTFNLLQILAQGFVGLLFSTWIYFLTRRVRK